MNCIGSPSFGNDKGISPPTGSKKLTLNDCILLALENNRILKRAYLDRITEKYDLQVAEDKFYPHGQGVFSTERSSIESDNSRTANWDHNAAFTITQEIPLGGGFSFVWGNDLLKMRNVDDTYSSSWELSFNQPLLKGAGLDVGTASVRRARLQEKQNMLSFQETLTDTITSTIQSYRNYLSRYMRLTISRNSLERAKQTLEINKSLIDAGRMAAVELVQTQAEIANREFDLLTAENNLDSSRLDLIKVLDIDKETQFEPVKESEVETALPALEDATAIAFGNRPDYLREMIGLELAKIDYTVADNNRLWDLSVNAGIGNSNSDEKYGDAIHGLYDIDRSDWNVGLTLTIPFRDLTITQAYLNAKTALKKTEMGLEESRDNIEIEIRDAVRDAQMKLKQMALAREARILAEKKLEIENEKLKAGRTTNFQIVQFQDDLVMAQNNEVDAVTGYLNSLTSLDSKLGTTLKTWRIEIKETKEEDIEDAIHKK